MKRRELIAIATGALAGMMLAPTTARAAVHQTVEDVYQTFSVRQDKVAHRALLADDYLLLENGEILDIAGDLALMPAPDSGDRRTDAFELKSVKMAGDTAWALAGAKRNKTVQLACPVTCNDRHTTMPKRLFLRRPFFSGTRQAGGLGLLLAAGLLAAPAGAKPVTRPSDSFSETVQLAPFVVSGKQLSVSIHARSGRDRRYAEAFSEEVMKGVYEGVTESTGKGLVIIGKKGEPHPIFVFRKFLALADAGKLDPAVAARGPELFAMLNHWQHSVDEGRVKESAPEGNVDLEFEKIVTALPLPLQGMGAKLYQLAWFENFDDARVEAKLRALRPAALERDLFAHFDWVFYLPPKGAFDQVLDQLIADALKEDDAGFLARTAVKGVMLVVKPKIRRVIEGVRKGMLFQTVVQARTTLGEKEVSSLTGAYIETMMPDEGRTTGGTGHERAVAALRDQPRKFAEQAKVPLTEPVSSEGTPPVSIP